jgi:hypothetical protein
MAFPDHIESILDAWSIAADTKAALYDLYVSLGNEALEIFADLAEHVADPSTLRPEDTGTIRATAIERYVRKNHPLWLEGRPTPSLWHPRLLQGRASGLAIPLGSIGDGVSTDLSRSVAAMAKTILGELQPLPNGILVLGRNAHYGGRPETISFDVVAEVLEDAVQISLAAGQQHTIPGSVGETSGTANQSSGLALLWEIQPNVLKPAGERNRAISRIYRRHRNWHVLTLLSALEWLRQNGLKTYILRGDALAATHEVNQAKPVTATIRTLHERTVRNVVEARGWNLRAIEPGETEELLESDLMNVGLTKHVQANGADGAVWVVEM